MRGLLFQICHHGAKQTVVELFSLRYAKQAKVYIDDIFSWICTKGFAIRSANQATNKLKISILGNTITPYFFIWCIYYTIRLNFYFKNQLFEGTDYYFILCLANARGSLYLVLTCFLPMPWIIIKLNFQLLSSYHRIIPKNTTIPTRGNKLRPLFVKKLNYFIQDNV